MNETFLCINYDLLDLFFFSNDFKIHNQTINFLTPLLSFCCIQILTWLFQNTLAFVSLLFVGHISGKALELDSAGKGETRIAE